VVDKPRVFMSVGSNGTQRQREAVDRVFAALSVAGLSPRQMERNEWSAEQPLRAIRKVIDECSGAVVIAFSRYEFERGIEHVKGGDAKPLHDIHLPTVWNQIEATLAYSRGLPLFWVCETGLLEEGLMEQYDWKVFWTDFSADELGSERFAGYVGSWRKLVDEFVAAEAKNATRVEKPAAAEPDLSKIGLGKLLSMLHAGQAAAVVGVIGTMLAAAFKLGGGKVL